MEWEKPYEVNIKKIIRNYYTKTEKQTKDTKITQFKNGQRT